MRRPSDSSRIFALLALLLAPLAACAAPAPNPAVLVVADDQPIGPPPPGLGRIYFYRTDLPLMVALAPDIVVNGRRVGGAGYDQVFFRDARPGRYEVFLATDPENPVYLTLAAGELRFVKTAVDIGLGGTKLSAELVEEAAARREIEQQRRARATPPKPPRAPD